MKLSEWLALGLIWFSGLILVFKVVDGTSKRPLIYFNGGNSEFLRKKCQRVVVLRVLVSRAEMMRVWKAKKKESVGISSCYANCMFAERWRTSILALSVVGTWEESEDTTRLFGFVYFSHPLESYLTQSKLIHVWLLKSTEEAKKCDHRCFGSRRSGRVCSGCRNCQCRTVPWKMKATIFIDR